MFKAHNQVTAFDPQLDRDLIASINEVRSRDELGRLTKMAEARLRGRAGREDKRGYVPSLRALAVRL